MRGNIFPLQMPIPMVIFGELESEEKMSVFRSGCFLVSISEFNNIDDFVAHVKALCKSWYKKNALYVHVPGCNVCTQ